MSALLLVFSDPAFAAGYCTRQKLKYDLSGDWKGEDSYLLRIEKLSDGPTCFSIYEANTSVVREIRDVVIRDGEVVHLAYYTHTTNAYVVYTNIKVKGDDMIFDWFSSYDLAKGKDTYIRQKTTG